MCGSKFVKTHDIAAAAFSLTEQTPLLTHSAAAPFIAWALLCGTQALVFKGNEDKDLGRILRAQCRGRLILKPEML